MITRIAILVPEYKTEQVKRGGLITVADSLIRIFTAQPNFEVEVISPRLWSKSPENQQLLKPSSWISGPKISKTKINDVPVTYVGSRCAEIELCRYKPTKQLQNIFQRFDCVFAVCGNSAFFNLLRGSEEKSLGTFASFTKSERAAMLEQSSGLKQIAKKLVAWQVSRLDLRSLKLPSQVFVMNKSMNDLAQLHGREDVKYFTPPVGFPGDSSMIEKRAKSKSSKLHLLTVCRLGDPRKNLLELVNIYAELAEQYSINFMATIAGAGPLDASVRHLISERKLDSLIHVIEDPDDSELENLYINTDLFVLPSKEEGFGMVFLEAMRWGVPVVTTKTDGARFIFEKSDSGILIDLDEQLSANMSKAIFEIASDPQLLMDLGDKSRKLVEQRYSDEVVSKIIMNSMEDLHNAALKF